MGQLVVGLEKDKIDNILPRTSILVYTTAEDVAWIAAHLVLHSARMIGSREADGSKQQPLGLCRMRGIVALPTGPTN